MVYGVGLENRWVSKAPGVRIPPLLPKGECEMDFEEKPKRKFIGEPSFKSRDFPTKTFILVGILLFLLIGLCIQRYKIENLEEEIVRIKKEQVVKTEELAQDLALLRLEFDTYKKMTSDEFVRTWQSFGVIRNNFLALGTGFHLGRGDFYPDDESGTDEVEE